MKGENIYKLVTFNEKLIEEGCIIYLGDLSFLIVSHYRKTLQFLDNLLKPIMQNSWSYIRNKIL